MAQDDEFSAMQAVYKSLEPLAPEARQRVMAYINSRLEIAPAPSSPSSHAQTQPVAQVTATNAQQVGAVRYSTFAELFDAAQPSSQSDKALVAGYWMQVCQGNESFDSQSAHSELKHLGHGLANITQSMDVLKSQKPALVLQLKKAGNTQQARKIYKVTMAGLKAVEAMIGG